MTESKDHIELRDRLHTFTATYGTVTELNAEHLFAAIGIENTITDAFNILGLDVTPKWWDMFKEYVRKAKREEAKLKDLLMFLIKWSHRVHW